MGAPVGVEAGVEAGVARVLVHPPAFHPILGGGSGVGGVLFGGGRAEEARDPVGETGDVFVVGFVLAEVGEGEDASPQRNRHAYDHTRFASDPEAVPSLSDALT
jgi:hypothetical protein